MNVKYINTNGWYSPRTFIGAIGFLLFIVVRSRGGSAGGRAALSFNCGGNITALQVPVESQKGVS